MRTKLTSELVKKAQEGDRNALEQLLLDVDGLIRRTARANGSSDVDDVVQCVSLKLIESLATLINPDSFSAWLTTLTKNETRMLQRQNRSWQREQLHLDFGKEELSSTRSITPDIRRAVRLLPPSQQQLIEDRYVRGRSYRQTSKALNVSVPALKSRLHRARHRLKKELDMTLEQNKISLSASDVNSLACAARFRSLNKDAAINGLLLDPEGYAVATDGHRLIVRALPAFKELDSKLLVAPNFSDTAQGPAELSIHMDEVQLQFQADQFAWGIETCDFPDYSTILPGPARHSIELKRKDLIAALAHMETYLEESHPAIGGCEYSPVLTLMLNSDSSQLTLSTTQSIGYVASDITLPEPQTMRWEHTVSVAGEISGFAESFRIKINAHYLLEAIETLETSKITLAFTASHKPIDVVGGPHRVVTMPVA